MKMIFPAALAVVLFALPRAHAVSADSATNAPKSARTNTNPEAAMTALFGDPVIAKGTGFEIKRSEMDLELTRIKSILAAQGRTASPEDTAALKGQVLNNLIARRLLLSKATEADRAKGRENFEETAQRLKTNAKLTDDQFNQRLNQQLKLLGLTREEWEKQSIEQATIPVVLDRELKVTVSDAEATNFYNTHPAEFEAPEKARLSDILLLTIDPTTRTPLTADQQQAKRKQIEDILKRARAGENFTNLAAQYSEDLNSKDNGGELPPLSRDQMSPELAAAAFSLTNNQVSDIIEMTHGYYIIKLLDRIPAQKTAYDKVASSIKQFLVRQQEEKLAPPYLNALKKEYSVEILDPDLKALETADTNKPPDALKRN